MKRTFLKKLENLTSNRNWGEFKETHCTTIYTTGDGWTEEKKKRNRRGHNQQATIVLVPELAVCKVSRFNSCIKKV